MAQEKVSKSRVGGDKGTSGPSPFTARRSETEVFSNRRRSFLPGEPEDKSPDDGDSDEVVRRARGPGLGGDILKEMKVRQELKRASVIPKSDQSEDHVDGKEEAKSFGNIHLR